jgi:hypothetical protein
LATAAVVVVLAISAVAAMEPVTAMSTSSTQGPAAAAFSFGSGRGFLGGREQNFVRSGGSGSGLGVTARGQAP